MAEAPLRGHGALGAPGAEGAKAERGTTVAGPQCTCGPAPASVLEALLHWGKQTVSSHETSGFSRSLEASMRYLPWPVMPTSSPLGVSARL